MRNLVRRLKRLEQQHFDVTGLVPRSEAWYEFYLGQDGPPACRGPDSARVIRK